MRLVIDFPVVDEGDVIRVGRFIFRKCDECPLSEDEIALMLIVDGLNLGFGDDFEIVGVVGNEEDCD